MVVTRRFAGIALLFAVSGCLSAQSDPLIEQARQFALDYSRNLPDYVVTRDTSRYMGVSPQLAGVAAAGDWTLQDTISGELTVRNGAESYGNLRDNGKPIAALPPGVWSTGEFASELMAVFAPERHTKLKAGRSESLRNRQVKRYSFTVDRRHSNWILSAKNIPGYRDVSSFACGYEGSIWIDVEMGKTLRVQMFSTDMPIGSPLKGVISQTDYDFADIDGTQYVLPTHAETTSCEARRGLCFRNVSEFHGYKKFSVNSDLTFEAGH